MAITLCGVFFTKELATTAAATYSAETVRD